MALRLSEIPKAIMQYYTTILPNCKRSRDESKRSASSFGVWHHRVRAATSEDFSVVEFSVRQCLALAIRFTTYSLQ
jgi:hypothetical protein